MSGYRIKPWEELTMSDDYMFKLIMSRKRICTKGRLGEIDNSIRAFLQYVDGVMTADHFVQEIDEEIQKVKRIEGEAVSYMTYEMKMKEERKEGMREVLQILPLLGMNLSLEEIAKRTGCTIEYLHQLKAAIPNIGEGVT